MQSLLTSGGDPSIFIEKPIAATLLGVALLVMAIPVVNWIRRRRTAASSHSARTA
jgi:TctA family transporter